MTYCVQVAHIWHTFDTFAHLTHLTYTTYSMHLHICNILRVHVIYVYILTHTWHTWHVYIHITWHTSHVLIYISSLAHIYIHVAHIWHTICTFAHLHISLAQHIVCIYTFITNSRVHVFPDAEVGHFVMQFVHTYIEYRMKRVTWCAIGCKMQIAWWHAYWHIFCDSRYLLCVHLHHMSHMCTQLTNQRYFIMRFTFCNILRVHVI